MKLDAQTLTGDLFGGITAGVVALPLALAFGVTSGLPGETAALAGLYGAIAVGILASVFGGTRLQVSGPTGPMTVVSASVIATAAAKGDPIDLGFVFGTFALAGLFQIVLGLLRVGDSVRYIPYPVVSGFMSGIGVIILVLQWFPMFGLASPASPLDVLERGLEVFAAPNLLAIAVTVATAALIWVWPRVTRRVPGSLVALIAGTAAVSLLQLDVPVLGNIPAALPTLRIPALGFDRLVHMIPPALTLAALGAIDSLLTSVVHDNMTRTRHAPNRELVGQGIGNLVAGLIGGLPGAGATMRTVVNIQAGGRTRLSGVVHGLLLAGVLFGLAPLAGLVPKPVLAGILITVGVGIIDVKGLRRLPKMPRADAGVMLVVLSMTVLVDLLWAVGAGMVLAALVFVREMTRLTERNSTVMALEDQPWADEANLPPEVLKRVCIKHLEGPVFFGFATRLVELVERMPDARVVLVRMEHVPYMDHSGLVALEDALMRLNERGVRVALTGPAAQPLELMEAMGVIPEMVPRERVFSSLSDALAELRDNPSPAPELSVVAG
ncbi:MAG: SulP family inorganic anion transporter [Myxococcales bacterium]|nr:SulP family inorganic anion transporter [Myxococcales bacterium]